MNWIKKKWRLWRGRCPYCDKKMTKGYTGLFFNGVIACPDRHYAEEIIMGAGVLVYDVGLPKPTTLRDPPTPDLRCTCDNEQGCDTHDAKVIEFKGEGVPRRIKG